MAFGDGGSFVVTLSLGSLPPARSKPEESANAHEDEEEEKKTSAARASTTTASGAIHGAYRWAAMRADRHEEVPLKNPRKLGTGLHAKRTVPTSRSAQADATVAAVVGPRPPHPWSDPPS